MRLLLHHRSLYRYPRPTVLGPHLIRLRPASHAQASVASYSLRVTPPGEIRWQQDPVGNRRWRKPMAPVSISHPRLRRATQNSRSTSVICRPLGLVRGAP